MRPKLYRLNDDINIPLRWHLGEVLSPEGEFPDLLAGEPCGFSELDGELSQAGRALDFCQTSFAVPVARDALAEVIKSVARQDVECIPLRVDGKEGFKVINALRTLRCVDESRSRFVKWTVADDRPDRIGQYHEVSDLTIDLNCVPSNVSVFRVWGWQVVLVVDENVKAVMEDAGCLGALFERINTSNG